VDVLVCQTFLESLNFDLNVEANLLFLVEFGGKAIEVLLLCASEVFKIAAKLLQLGMHVARVVGM